MKLLYLAILICVNAYCIIPATREISIFIECGDVENIKTTLEKKYKVAISASKKGGNVKNANTIDSIIGSIPGISAVTYALLAALYQEASPILVTGPLLDNIMQHKALFDKFVSTQDVNALYNQYKKFPAFNNINSVKLFKAYANYFENLYNRLKNLISATPDLTNLKDILLKDQVFSFNAAPAGLKDISDDSIINVFGVYLACSKWPINNYIIKSIMSENKPDESEKPDKPGGKSNERRKSNNLYLILPISYLKSLGIDYNESSNILQDTHTLSDVEKKLGLKIDHMPQVKLKQYNNIKPDKTDVSACLKLFMNSLPKIFVTNDELPDRDIWWGIFMIGHGLFNQESADSAQSYYSKLHDEQKKAEEVQGKIGLLNKELKEINDETDKNKISSQVNELNAKLESYTTNIDSLKTNIEAQEASSVSAGLSLNDFKKLLIFLNSKINTSFVFYISCYAGGSNFVDAYTVNQSPLILNFPIASNSLIETPSYIELSRIYLHWYDKSDESLMPDMSIIVDTAKKQPKLWTPFDFPEFFKKLKNINGSETFYKDLLSNVNGEYKDPKYASSYVGNTSSIRFPGTGWFSLASLDNKITALTNVKVLAQGSKALTINNKEAILIYAPEINFDINVNLNSKAPLPAIISMIPGKAEHKINAVNAPNYSYPSIFESFFRILDLESAKAFIVDKMQGINKFNIANLTSINNINIFINALIDNVLTHAVFFYDQNNNLYGATWDNSTEFPKNFTTLIFKYKNSDFKNFFTNYFKDANKSLANIEQFTLKKDFKVAPIKKVLEQKSKIIDSLKLKK